VAGLAGDVNRWGGFLRGRRGVGEGGRRGLRELWVCE
jgi:hypothetical protein